MASGEVESGRAESPVLRFRGYEPADRSACLAMFDANCPDSFAPNERVEYEAFLDDAPEGYEVCVRDGSVVGAFGLIGDAQRRSEPGLRWIMIHPDAQGAGIGGAMMRRVVGAAAEAGASTVHIAASHRSAPFFARHGAIQVEWIEEGWGPGMHRVDMTLEPGGG